MAKEKKSRVNINNKRASFDYEFLETYTAGIVLVGTEIKSIRAGRASMSDAFCFFEKGQLYVRGINIALYAAHGVSMLLCVTASCFSRSVN